MNDAERTARLIRDAVKYCNLADQHVSYGKPWTPERRRETIALLSTAATYLHIAAAIAWQRPIDSDPDK